MTSNEYHILKKNAYLLDGPILEVGGRRVSKFPTNKSLFPDKEYLSLDLEMGDEVDIIHDMEKPLDRKFNSVICCSVLEHVQRPWLVARNIERCLNPGGHLYVAAPFVWRYHNYPGDYWRYTDSTFKVIFPRIEWDFIYYATRKRGEIAGTYHELSSIYKETLSTMSATVCVVIGLGVRK